MAASLTHYAVVVDDDVLILMHTSDVLADAGFETIEVSDGDEARLVFDERGHEIALLFTDVQMPGSTDGFALARYVAECWPRVEIVVASGRLRPGPDDLPEGATFIGKPFGADLIRDHLRRTLPQERWPGPLASP